MGHDLLTWVKQPLHICTCHTTFFSIATFSPYKSMGLQIWPCHRKVNGHPSIIWLNLVNLKSRLQFTKIQPWSFLGLWEEFLGVFFLPYMGMTAILFNDAEQFEQIDNMPSTEGPKCNLVKTGQAVSEKKTFNKILYMYIAQGQGQITQEDKILTETKRVCYFNHTLSFSQRSLIHFQKMIFAIFPPYKRMGMQIWSYHRKVKGQPTTII